MNKRMPCQRLSCASLIVASTMIHRPPFRSNLLGAPSLDQRNFRKADRNVFQTLSRLGNVVHSDRCLPGD